MSGIEQRNGQHIWPGAWVWWALVGAAFSIGVVGIRTIGVFFLASGLVMTAVGLLLSSLRNRSALVVIAGFAAAPLLLAWFNRAGPGEVCHVKAGVTTCSERWSPWPILVVAIALLLLGVLAARRATGSHRTIGSTPRR